MIDVLLVVPPFTDPSQPGAAVPSLAAALRDTGARVRALDLNLDCWEYLLDPARQRRWLARISRRLAALDRRRALSEAECAEYTALADGWLRGRAALEEVSGASDVLRSPAFHDPRAYARAMHAVEGALAVLSAVYHPAHFEWGRFFPRRSVASSREILRSARAAGESPFVAYAADRVRPQLLELRPALVGISLTYFDQVVPALAIAAECRRALPHARVVLGGQIPSAWGDALDDDVALWSTVDAIVCGDGEEPIRGLVAAVQRGGPLAGIPGVRVRGAAFRPAPPPSLADLPCPEYGVLPLRRYLAPEPVLTVSASRGCYWGHCSFCAVSPAFRGGHRTRPPVNVRADVARLASLHGARHFCFADDALPRAMVQSLAADPPADPPIHWQAELRWDAVHEEEVGPLAAAGARNLVFGFESGSRRVLGRMRKGADLGRARRLLARCRAEGIGTNLQLFLGFPGERRADGAATVRFLDEVRGPRVTVSCGLFELQKGSPICERPETWGVRLARPAPGEDLVTRYDFAPPSGRWCRALALRIRRRFEAAAPQLHCGIHAHALLWLAAPAQRPRQPAGAVGLPAPRTAFRTFGRDPVAPRRRAATVLAYSLDRPTPVELGAVAAALMAALADGVPIMELLRPLGAAQRRRVRRVAARLARLGLLAPAPRHGRAPSASLSGPLAPRGAARAG